MDRHGIMNSGADAARGERRRAARRAAPSARHIGGRHGVAPARRAGRREPRRRRDRRHRRAAIACAARIVGIEVGELRRQDRRLQRVEPRIHAGDVADIALRQPYSRSARTRSANAASSVSTMPPSPRAPEILGRIEAERGEVAEAAEPLAVRAARRGICAQSSITRSAVAARQRAGSRRDRRPGHRDAPE